MRTQATTQDIPYEPAVRSHRVRLARPLITTSFALQRLGDLIIFYATSFPEYPNPLLRGVAMASLIWTTVLTIAVWRRRRWARYILTSFCLLYAFALSAVGLSNWEQYTWEHAIDPRAMPLAAAACYFGATMIFVRSQRVRHYAHR